MVLIRQPLRSKEIFLYQAQRSGWQQRDPYLSDMPSQPMEALHFQGNSQRSFRQRMNMCCGLFFFSSLVHQLHFQVLIF